MFNVLGLVLQEFSDQAKANSTLTFEFYQNKSDGFTVLCSEPDIRLEKNCFEGLVLTLSCIILRNGVHSSHRLKTDGFSGRNRIKTICRMKHRQRDAIPTEH